MNKKLTIISLLIVGCSFAFVACKTTEVEKTEERKASFIIGGSSFTVSKPYLGIFDNSGVVSNTLTLTATDNSKIEFHFEGSAPNSYPLKSFTDGYYKNSAGKQYNSSSGELVVTKYTTDGVTRKATGTFNFTAKTFVAPIDSVVITGEFTNASNEF